MDVVSNPTQETLTAVFLVLSFAVLIVWLVLREADAANDSDDHDDPSSWGT
jgi:hypothetical protein